MLSPNHSYHETQIKMDRCIFNAFINLRGFGFLLKQASGFAFRTLFSLGYLKVPVWSIVTLTFCRYLLEIISNDEWDLGMVFRSDVAYFCRTNILEQLKSVIGALNNPRYFL